VSATTRVYGGELNVRTRRLISSSKRTAVAYRGVSSCCQRGIDRRQIPSPDLGVVWPSSWDASLPERTSVRATISVALIRRVEVGILFDPTKMHVLEHKGPLLDYGLSVEPSSLRVTP
jgi:hypothetical protein